MMPIDTAAAVQAGQRAVAHGARSGVDLTKKYVRGLDVAYSSLMGRVPRVPRFKESTDD